MKYNKLFTLFILMYIITVPIFNNAKEIPLPDKQPQEIWITVFIHGIISLKPYLNLSNIVRFIQDDIDCTAYEQAIALTRDDPFFYQYHTMQERGLKKIDFSIVRPGAASVAFAKAYDCLISYGLQEPIKNYYYTFGWSGLISQSKRYEDAKKLYAALIQEFAHFADKNIHPKLRIVGYSHGANLALELARVYREHASPTPESNFTVDELVLVGAPLLPEGHHYIHSPLFKKIYHFFSYGDRVQRLDFFSLKRLFSKRTFKKHAGVPLPKNLVQITVRIKRPQKGKKSFFVLHHDIHKAMTTYRLLRKSDPGHSELWSFGWVPSGYRKNFPLYPIPFAAFTPWLIENIQHYADDARKISLELHPYAEHMIIKHHHRKKPLIVPFVSRQELDYLGNIVAPYKPLNFTQEEYDAHVQCHKEHAHREWLAKHKIWRFGHCRIQL